MTEIIKATKAPRANHIETNAGPLASTITIITNNDNQIIHMYCSILLCSFLGVDDENVFYAIPSRFKF